jgi:hypothetical protein
VANSSEHRLGDLVVKLVERRREVDTHEKNRRVNQLINHVRLRRTGVQKARGNGSAQRLTRFSLPREPRVDDGLTEIGAMTFAVGHGRASRSPRFVFVWPR